MGRARILVADDHASMLERVSLLLATDFDVVAAVSDGVAAVEAALTLHPDLLVLDISMPRMTGLDAAAKLAEQPHPAPVVFLTVHDDQEFIDAARDVGALGYVLKRNIATELLPIIRRALAGKATFLATLIAHSTLANS
ncbi:MAG TPA: response regulator transcription factor [Vicinamibacterales bacterium]